MAVIRALPVFLLLVLVLVLSFVIDEVSEQDHTRSLGGRVVVNQPVPTKRYVEKYRGLNIEPTQVESVRVK